MNNYKITIIMAVYNRAAKVEQAISSVVNQTYNNIEFIIIDGGSTDGTVEIIKKYGDKIAYWISEQDNGLYNALNKGISFATGDYIQILGSDDSLYSEEAISSVVKYLNTDVDVLCCCVRNVYPESGMERHIDNENVRYRDKYVYGMAHHPGMLVKRKFYKKYNLDETYKIASDYKFFLQLYLIDNCNFKFIDEIVSFFEYGEGISSDDNYRNIMYDENKRIHNELGLHPYTSNVCGVPNGSSVSREKIKNILKYMKIFESVRYFYRRFCSSKWYKHKCSNKICRWCGR